MEISGVVHPMEEEPRLITRRDAIVSVLLCLFVAVARRLSFFLGGLTGTIADFYVRCECLENRYINGKRIYNN